MISPKIVPAYRKLMTIHAPVAFRILKYVADAGEVTVTQVHNEIRGRYSRCCRILSEMHKQGYVRKRVAGRNVYISIHEDNMEKIIRIIKQLNQTEC